MHNADLKISFIIASISESQKLQECISSIEKAYDYAKNIGVEILLVFQDMDENTSLKIKYPELTTIDYIKEKGLSLARNFAIKKSKGDYFVFLDDDAAVKENFLDTLLKNISSITAGAFCGKIIDPLNNLLYSECFLSSESKYLNRFEFMYFMGSAHVLKKSAIERIGLYDERFGAGAQYPAAEESDMFFRLKHRGEKIAYLPELIFYHPINNVTSDLKRFNYSYALGAMLAKQITLDIGHFFIYLSVIFELVAKSFLRTLQVSFSSKKLMVKNLRFRYKSVLTGTLKGVWDYLWNL